MRNKLTQDTPTLFVDQYGGKIVASSAKELQTKCGVKSAVRKMYIDKKDGGTVWNGYVIGSRWFTALKWAEVPV